MSAWTHEALAAIGDAEELALTVGRGPVPIWVVHAGDDLYVRAYRGTVGIAYRTKYRRYSYAGDMTADDVRATTRKLVPR